MTKIERLLLANQFRILAKLTPTTEASHYDTMIEIVEQGYTGEYPSLTNAFSNELSEAICDEVAEILNMHRFLGDAYSALADHTSVDAGKTKFRGFDRNEENMHYRYADFQIYKLGHWKESANADNDVDSHYPMLDRYRRMLSRWKATTNPHKLTSDELMQIIDQ
jgi:hypothetical protein